jgi:hypothetical protein
MTAARLVTASFACARPSGNAAGHPSEISRIPRPCGPQPRKPRRPH